MQVRRAIGIGILTVTGLFALAFLAATPLLLYMAVMAALLNETHDLYTIADFLGLPCLFIMVLGSLALGLMREWQIDPQGTAAFVSVRRAFRSTCIGGFPILPFVVICAVSAIAAGSVIYSTAIDAAVALWLIWLALCFVVSVHYLRRPKIAFGYALPLVVLALFLRFEDKVSKALDLAKLRFRSNEFAECVRTAAPLDGGRFKVCEHLSDDDSDTDTMIIYDSTDQISLPAARRSVAWKNFVLSLEHTPFGMLDFKVQPLRGHFYKVFFFDNHAETGL
jgi:hypothetical protein